MKSRIAQNKITSLILEDGSTVSNPGMINKAMIDLYLNLSGSNQLDKDHTLMDVLQSCPLVIQKCVGYVNRSLARELRMLCGELEMTRPLELMAIIVIFSRNAGTL